MIIILLNRFRRFIQCNNFFSIYLPKIEREKDRRPPKSVSAVQFVRSPCSALKITFCHSSKLPSVLMSTHMANRCWNVNNQRNTRVRVSHYTYPTTRTPLSLSILCFSTMLDPVSDFVCHMEISREPSRSSSLCISSCTGRTMPSWNARSAAFDSTPIYQTSPRLASIFSS